MPVIQSLYFWHCVCFVLKIVHTVNRTFELNCRHSRSQIYRDKQICYMLPSVYIQYVRASCDVLFVRSSWTRDKCPFILASSRMFTEMQRSMVWMKHLRSEHFPIYLSSKLHESIAKNNKMREISSYNVPIG